MSVLGFRVYVGLALHIFEAFIGRNNKPIFLSRVWKICPIVLAIYVVRAYIINHYFTFIC